MKRNIRVQVPATSANLGPGFDSLGLALNLYDRFTVETADETSIEGCIPEHANDGNLFVRAYRRGLEELGLPFKGIKVRFDADIPIARGLGSSSACIVGGLLAAQSVGAAESRKDRLDFQALLDLATEIEGHPDNVGPALLGGFAVSIVQDGRVASIRTDVDEGLVFNALVPPFPLETVKARAILPACVEFRDAAFNAGRAAMVAAAFLSRLRKTRRSLSRSSARALQIAAHRGIPGNSRGGALGRSLRRVSQRCGAYDHGHLPRRKCRLRRAAVARAEFAGHGPLETDFSPARQ